MKATGIVRRIDELGRVVIPKEIRKTLRLREGDPLEIFTDKDGLLFKKYSPIENLESFSEDICLSLNGITEKTVVITDSDSVLFAKGTGAKEFDKKRISKELEKVLSERKSVVSNVADGGSIIRIVEGETSEFNGQLIIPVISGGDALGAIILFAKNKDDKMDYEDIKLAQFASEFLSRQFS